MIGLSFFAWVQLPGQNCTSHSRSGKIIFDGHPTPYLIRHLPVSSFPQLPPPSRTRSPTAAASFRKPTRRTSRKMSFTPASSTMARPTGPSSAPSMELSRCWSSSRAAPATPCVLASAPETERLQSHGSSGVLGFNWGIDPASPEQVHEAQMDMPHPPAAHSTTMHSPTPVDRPAHHLPLLSHAMPGRSSILRTSIASRVSAGIDLTSPVSPSNNEPADTASCSLII